MDPRLVAIASLRREAPPPPPPQPKVIDPKNMKDFLP